MARVNFQNVGPAIFLVSIFCDHLLNLPGTAYIQTMTAEQAEATSFDAFDVTKVWPRDQFPLQEFGRIVLNKNPDNYHRDVDQAAFSPSSLVPGIEASPDMLLQWRK